MTDNKKYPKGYSKYYGHHGEVLQGAFMDNEGILQRALITVPCKIYYSSAIFTHNDSDELTIIPKYKHKALRAVKEAEKYVPFPEGSSGGELKLYSNIPKNLGFGSSTADVCAAIGAYLNSWQKKVTEKEMALLAVKAESASDAIMFRSKRVLFCQRTGKTLESFGEQSMEVTILGFNAGGNKGVNTLNFKLPEYTKDEIKAFKWLRNNYRRAVLNHDYKLLGKTATQSAIINQKYLYKANFEQLIKVGERSGADGIQVAHSGNIAGFIFENINYEQLEDKINSCEEYLDELGYKKTWLFETKL